MSIEHEDLPSMTSHLVAQVEDFDREHARTIIAKMLEGPAFITDLEGIERELDELARAGLLEYSAADPADIPKITGQTTGWVATPTLAAWLVGVRLARSVELLCVLAHYGLATRRGDPWKGASAQAVLRELDLRDGGRGDVSDIYEWLRVRKHADIVRLPRRDGLDPEVSRG